MDAGGCWGWRGRIGKVIAIDGSQVDEKGPLADLDLINWKDRDVVICFDSNAACNPSVGHARRDLAQELAARHASVRIANLPNEKGVNGPDDYLACLGDAAIMQVLDSARLFAEAADAQLRQILQSLESGSPSEMTPDTQQATFDLLADIEDPEQRRIFVSRVAKALGYAKSDVKAAVQSRIAKLAEQSRVTAERTRVVRLQNVDVHPAALVGGLESFFAERLYLPSDWALLLAIWVMNTWTFEIFDTTPYLLIESATPQCGKTTLFSLLEAVAREPLQVADMTPAAMFRVIEARKPTFLIDEAESLVGKSEKADAIRAIANAGYKRGAKVIRTVGEGADLQVKEFETFAPKAFACIGGLKGPLLSRCIVITMSKRPPGVRLQSSRVRVLRRVAQPLREQLEAYAVQSRKRLAEMYDAEPDEGYWTQLPDREGELWGPLLLHARLAGPEVESRALGTATALSGRKKSIQAQERNFCLAGELLEALRDLGKEKFSPGELVSLLTDRETWGEVLASKRTDKEGAATVGRFLANFRLSSRMRTHGQTLYSSAEAIERISAHLPETTAASAASAADSGNSRTSDAADRTDGTETDPELKATGSSIVADDGKGVNPRDTAAACPFAIDVTPGAAAGPTQGIRGSAAVAADAAVHDGSARDAEVRDGAAIEELVWEP